MIPTVPPTVQIHVPKCLPRDIFCCDLQLFALYSGTDHIHAWNRTDNTHMLGAELTSHMPGAGLEMHILEVDLAGTYAWSRTGNTHASRGRTDNAYASCQVSWSGTERFVSSSSTKMLWTY